MLSDAGLLKPTVTTLLDESGIYALDELAAVTVEELVERGFKVVVARKCITAAKREVDTPADDLKHGGGRKAPEDGMTAHPRSRRSKSNPGKKSRAPNKRSPPRRGKSIGPTVSASEERRGTVHARAIQENIDRIERGGTGGRDARETGGGAPRSTTGTRRTRRNSRDDIQVPLVRSFKGTPPPGAEDDPYDDDDLGRSPLARKRRRSRDGIDFSRGGGPGRDRGGGSGWCAAAFGRSLLGLSRRDIVVLGAAALPQPGTPIIFVGKHHNILIDMLLLRLASPRPVALLSPSQPLRAWSYLGCAACCCIDVIEVHGEINSAPPLVYFKKIINVVIQVFHPVVLDNTGCNRTVTLLRRSPTHHRRSCVLATSKIAVWVGLLASESRDLAVLASWDRLVRWA